MITAALEDLRIAVNVQFVADCVALLEGVRRFPAHLIVLDFGTDADACSAEVQVVSRVAPETPIVVFTGYEGERARETLLRQGAVDVIHKPTSFGEFRQAVKSAMQHAPRSVD